MNSLIEIEPRELFLNKLKQGELIEVQSDWFERYFHLQFLADYLTTSNLEELIVHSPQKLELIGPEGSTIVDAQLDEELWNWVACYQCLKHGKPFHLNWPFASLMIPFPRVQIRASFIHQATLPGRHHKGFFRILQKEFFTLRDFSSSNLEFLFKDVANTKKISSSVVPPEVVRPLCLKPSFHHAADKKNHIITIEDAHELQHSYPWVTSLLAREHEQYSMEKYLSYAMRMRPERIVLGEIRSAEVVPLILALNSGHNGMLATVHANSAPDALYRLGTLLQTYNRQSLPYEVAMALLCHNLDFIVHMERKEVVQVIQVLGHDEGRLIYDTVFECPEKS